MQLSATIGRQMYKVFQKKDFDQCDGIARETAKKFWYTMGYVCKDNPDEYGVDLIVEGNNKRFYCEVEVKKAWHGVQFTFPTIHLPVRKAKFFTKPTQFMVFNNSLTHAAVIGRKTVMDSPQVVVPNIKISAGEKFYDIPANKAHFVQTLIR
jgi:hypothetical protein